MKKIVVIQGHPDPAGNRLCHGLAGAYVDGARQSGHDVELVDVAKLHFPLLGSQSEWQQGADGTPDDVKPAQAAIVAADHVVMIYPLWLGTMPALLKAFIEQVLRPGVALSNGEGFPKPLFTGKSARVVVTMGMPALAYRWYFAAHSLKSLERNILKFIGMKPVRDTIFGMVEGASEEKRKRWLEQMRRLGANAA